MRRLWEVEIPLSGLAFVGRGLSLLRRVPRGRRSLEQVASGHGLDRKQLAALERRLAHALSPRSAP